MSKPYKVLKFSFPRNELREALNAASGILEVHSQLLVSHEEPTDTLTMAIEVPNKHKDRMAGVAEQLTHFPWAEQIKITRELV